MPRWGMAMSKGTIVKWHKSEGETVRKGEPLYEVDAEKIIVSVESPEDGVMLRILHPEGSTVDCFEPIAVIGQPGEKVEPELTPKQDVQRITPAARRAAAELGIDISQVKGTGPQGRVTREDVLAHARPQQLKFTVPVAEKVPWTSLRKDIANRLSRSYAEALHVTLMRDVDMKATTDLVKGLKAENPNIGFNEIIIMAVARGLKEHRVINSSFSIDGMIIFDAINIGIATSIEKGLIVPVIRDADRKTVFQIADEMKILVDKARNNQLTIAETEGGTFTISNLGMFGIDAFTPIINPPQTAILGVGTIAERPVVVNGVVEARQMVTLSLSFDHRVVDGVEASRFLSTLVRLLQNPQELLAK